MHPENGMDIDIAHLLRLFASKKNRTGVSAEIDIRIDTALQDINPELLAIVSGSFKGYIIGVAPENLERGIIHALTHIPRGNYYGTFPIELKRRESGTLWQCYSGDIPLCLMVDHHSKST